VRRRFFRGFVNFLNLYEPIFDSWMMFDNSKEKPRLIAKRKNGLINVVDHVLFKEVSKYKGVK